MNRISARILTVFLRVSVSTILTFLVGCGEGKKDIPLPEGEGKAIGGSMAFDGDSFWGTRIPLSFTSKEKTEIIVFDKSGKIINTFTPEENFRGLTFDGENIWTADAFGSEGGAFFGVNGNFYTIDFETGILSKQFTITEDYMLDGLAAGEDRLWAYVIKVSEEGGEKLIFEIDPETESIVNKIGLPKDISSTCSGMAYADGYLWAVNGLMLKKVLKIDTQSGDIIKKYDFSGRVINGITTDGERIFLVDGEKQILFTLKK